MRNGFIRAAFVALSCLSLASCMEASRLWGGGFGEDGPRTRAGGHARELEASRSGVRPGSMQRGTDDFLNEAALGDQKSEAIVVPRPDDEVELSLVNASIPSAAKAILGDALGLSYVVSDKVEGTITVQTTSPVSKGALLDLFEAALSANGAQIRKDGDTIEIVPGTSGTSMFRVAGKGAADGSSILVAPLSYISASEMAELLAPLSDEGLKVVADKKRNLLLLSGTRAQKEAALDALNLFDVDVLRGKSIALVQVSTADPEAIVTELKQIFENEEGGMLSDVVEFIPNKRLSSVLVVSSRAQYVDRAQAWIRRLDTAATDASVYLATYSLQNRSAVEVAPILNQLLQGTIGETAPKVSEAADAEPMPADAPKEVGVAADDSRNALIVRGTRSVQQQVKALLTELDSAPRQVLLEATIAEVTLNNDMSLGTRWFFETGNWRFGFSDLDTGSVSGSNPGFTGVFGAGDAEVAISALESVTDVKIISTPTLMVLDNKEGILQIGDQVPIATQTSTSSTGDNAPVLTKIDYRDTGVILRVKPRIGAGGRVILDINQEVSDVARNRTSGIDSPTISQRKVQTSVALGDGQTLALGGLVQQTDNVTKTETPGLGKIPVVGNLFRNKTSNKDRRELLILIRPRVVNGDDDAEAVTAYWRRMLAQSNSVISTGLGNPTHQVADYAN
jgi:general secretion pathway protein D